MLDKKTLNFLEKIAAYDTRQDATGMSQYKKRDVKTVQNHTGAGTGLGAVLGAGAGALSKKYKAISTAGGALLGALAGNRIGKHTKTQRQNRTLEGTVKRQRKTKAENAQPDVPKLNDSAVLKLLKGNK